MAAAPAPMLVAGAIQSAIREIVIDNRSTAIAFGCVIPADLQAIDSVPVVSSSAEEWETSQQSPMATSSGRPGCPPPNHDISDN
jgi:hypothetical protein